MSSFPLRWFKTRVYVHIYANKNLIANRISSIPCKFSYSATDGAALHNAYGLQSLILGPKYKCFLPVRTSEIFVEKSRHFLKLSLLRYTQTCRVADCLDGISLSKLKLTKIYFSTVNQLNLSDNCGRNN